MRPLILVTNDDGIHSPGLHAALTALHPLGDLLIVAPTTQQSGTSRGFSPRFDGSISTITLSHDGQTFLAHHLDGAPAQAVLYGVIEIAPLTHGRPPDLIVSGINYGENLGSQTLISGTVGAALQGGDMGIRSLAVSLETNKAYHMIHGLDVDWTGAIHWLRHFARLALAPTPWPADIAALKIDLPDHVTPQTPWRATSQSRQPYFASLPSQRQNLTDPLPLDYQVCIDRAHLEPDSDIYAFAIDRVISVTPLSVNLTARVPLSTFAALILRQPPHP